MSASSVSVGIIGVGIGRRHLEGYLDTPEARVVALCDLDTERAAQLAQQYGLKEVQIFADHREMLAKASLDAVSLCVPNALHTPIALDCFAAGLHVLCEKPLATTAADAELIADAAATSGKFCMVGQVLRFRDDVVTLKQRAREIGDIYYSRVMARRAAGIPKWGGWFTRKSMAGGGPLIDTGVHLLDLAWWLADCPRPLSASATAYSALGPRKKGLGTGGAADLNGVFDVEDLAAGFVRFEGDFTIHFESSWAVYAAQDERYCHLHGSDGALLWQDQPQFVGSDGKVEALSAAPGNAFGAETSHFVNSILNNTQPEPDAQQGVTMMKILDALYQSAELKREVQI